MGWFNRNCKKRDKPTPKPKGARYVHVGGVPWSWKISYPNVYAQNTLTKKKILLTAEEMFGKDWDQDSCGGDDIPHGPYFNPKEIREALMKKLGVGS